MLQFFILGYNEVISFKFNKEINVTFQNQNYKMKEKNGCEN